MMIPTFLTTAMCAALLNDALSNDALSNDALSTDADANNRDVTDALPGFDNDRIASVLNDKSGGELARLVYRVDRIAPSTRQRLDAGIPNDPVENVAAAVGSWVNVTGTIIDRRRVRVPESIAEYLEFDVVEKIRIETAGGPAQLFTRRVAAAAAVGDQLSAGGVVVQTRGDAGNILTLVVASPRWTPETIADAGHRTLAESGVDLSVIEDLRRIDRSPLSDADATAFYQFIAAAERSEPPPNLPVTPTVELLRNSGAKIGSWVSLRVELSGVTRVVVDAEDSPIDEKRDHYFQYDAVADLGESDIVIKTPDGDLNFSGRYPVSIVSADPPDQRLMADSFDGGRSSGNDVYVPLNRTAVVEGLFYRLWAYDTELTAGDAKTQFGPLVMASSMRPVAAGAADPVGVQILGNIAAAVVVVGLIGTLVFFWVVRRGDPKTSRSLPPSITVDVPTRR